MVTDEESKKSPRNALQKEADKSPENGDGGAESMLSPGFRSVAAMAGWDEEALLIATLVVEDTPVRHFKQKKRSDFPLKTPPSNSRRKRRAQRKSPVSIPVTVLNLDDDDETAKEENEKPRAESKSNVNEEKKKTGDDDERKAEGSVLTCSTASSLPCMDRLREELSCAICLEICFEPSTTPCGHSFCKECLRSAADKCGKRCPKCRQLMSNGRSCTVNTVLWNTIQLLFPQEVESRKEAASNPPRTEHSIEHGTLPERRRSYQSGTSTRSRNISGLGGVASGGESSGLSSRRRRRREAAGPSQDEDAALAMRLQREEFMDAFRGGDETILSARANLRAMASRAINIRIRGHGI